MLFLTKSVPVNGIRLKNVGVGRKQIELRINQLPHFIVVCIYVSVHIIIVCGVKGFKGFVKIVDVKVIEIVEKSKSSKSSEKSKSSKSSGTMSGVLGMTESII